MIFLIDHLHFSPHCIIYTLIISCHNNFNFTYSISPNIIQTIIHLHISISVYVCKDV